jgi:hypothetical protein
MLAQIPATDSPYTQGGTINMGDIPLTTYWLDTAIDATRGECDVMLTSRGVRRWINKLLQSQQRWNDTVDIGAGFRVRSYDGMPIITDLHWEDYDKIIFFRKADAKLLVMQDFTYEPLAHTKDSTDFMIKGYFGFALEGRPVLLENFKLST